MSILILAGTALPAQKGAIKDSIKTVAPYRDTLVGGDGFIPRTVIDSFAPGEVAEPAKKKVTRVTQAQLDATQERIDLTRKRIVLCDSLLGVQKSQPTEEWPSDRVKALEAALAEWRKSLDAEEKRYADLRKRWESLP